MTIFTDLISNVALLLALSILYSFLTRIWKRGEITGQIFAGLLFGGVAVAGMILPFHYGPGVIFDGRSIAVSMAGLFGGPVTAAISTLIAGGYRLGLGGTGALTGVGVIFTSAALGVCYHYLRRKNPAVIKPLYLFIFGVIVHISMLLWMLTLPWPLAFEVLDKISIPVMLIFPLATLFLGTLLADQEGRNYAQDALRESEKKYRTVLESNPDPVVVYDMEGRVIYLNPAFTRVFGWSLEEQIGKKVDNFVPDENWPETRMMINKVTVLGESFSGLETRRYTKEGNVLDISISGSCYRDQEGNIAGNVINLQNISKKKRLEAQLQHTQKIEAIATLAGGTQGGELPMNSTMPSWGLWGILS